MHDDTSRLVDDDQMFILVEDRERHRRIRFDVTRRRRARLDLDDGTGTHLIASAALLSVDSNSSFGNPPLNGGPRNAAQESR
jgi:hypothetical protein